MATPPSCCPVPSSFSSAVTTTIQPQTANTNNFYDGLEDSCIDPDLDLDCYDACPLQPTTSRNFPDTHPLGLHRLEASLNMPFFASSANAPLPSPAAGNVAASSYFATQFQSLHSPQAQQQHHRMQGNGIATSRQQDPLPHQQQRQDSTSSTASDASSTTGAGAFSFDLLAEAAKRAQVACVMRDFEDMGL